MSRNAWNKEFQRINLCMGFSSTKYKIVHKQCFQVNIHDFGNKKKKEI